MLCYQISVQGLIIGDVGHGFDQAVGVTPFVVVPGENFDQISVNHLGKGKVHDGGFAPSNNIGGNNGLVRDCQDAGEIVHQGGLAEEIINFFDSSFAFHNESKVGDLAGDRGYAQGNPIK
mgnify:CR=1 FL=1